ncbi:MAG TPA: hypothetical protein VGX78_18530 [Pirellulales bacterium]|nr:hypothetical protein [Pirellulales bacterium]
MACYRHAARRLDPTALAAVGEADQVLKIRSASDATRACDLIHHRDELDGVWHMRSDVLADHLFHHRGKLDGVQPVHCHTRAADRRARAHHRPFDAPCWAGAGCASLSHRTGKSGDGAPA